jgi:hypothetical protein
VKIAITRDLAMMLRISNKTLGQSEDTKIEIMKDLDAECTRNRKAWSQQETIGNAIN